MVAATIFAPEISTLESQVAQLQAQIAAAQSRITALGEADTVASGALQSLQDAVAKISGLAPSALATLKAAALNLFQGGDDQDGGGGNEPIKPKPSPNGNGHSHKALPVLGQDIVFVSSTELKEHLEQQALEIAPELNGQTSVIDTEHYWETTPPDGSAWEFASHLQCFLEDAPTSSLQSQSVEIACLLPEVEQKQPYIELVKLSDALAYQKKHNGEIPTAYIGFKSKTRAEQWGRWLAAENNIADGFEVRGAKRLSEIKHELKLWGISFENIIRLTKLDFSGVPDDQTLNFWFEAAATVVEEKRATEQEDTVSVPASVVEVAPQPTYPTIDPNDVPVGVTLRSTDDALLREYIVWATVIARNNGVPTPTQKAIGRLIQGSEIEAYRPRSGLCRTFAKTLDAVVHLISGAGYQMADLVAAQEMQEIGLKKEPAPINAIPIETTVEVISVPVVPEVSEPHAPQVFQVGSLAQIISPRHGEQLVGQVGKVTVANSTGCVVVLGELTHWFCSDEIAKTSPKSQVRSRNDSGLYCETHREARSAFFNCDFGLPTSDLIQVGDWVELLENNQSYEVVLKKGDNFKLKSGNETKFAPSNMVKLLFRLPANFTPF